MDTPSTGGGIRVNTEILCATGMQAFSEKSLMDRASATDIRA